MQVFMNIKKSRTEDFYLDYKALFKFKQQEISQILKTVKKYKEENSLEKSMEQEVQKLRFQTDCDYKKLIIGIVIGIYLNICASIMFLQSVCGGPVASLVQSIHLSSTLSPQKEFC